MVFLAPSGLAPWPPEQVPFGWVASDNINSFSSAIISTRSPRYRATCGGVLPLLARARLRVVGLCWSVLDVVVSAGVRGCGVRE